MTSRLARSVGLVLTTAVCLAVAVVAYFLAGVVAFFAEGFAGTDRMGRGGIMIALLLGKAFSLLVAAGAAVGCATVMRRLFGLITTSRMGDDR